MSLITLYGIRFDSRVLLMTDYLTPEHSVTVVSVDRSEGAYVPAHFKVRLVRVHKLRFRLIRYCVILWKSIAALVASKPEVIQAEDVDALPIALLAAALLRVPVVYDAKELRIDCGRGFWQRCMSLLERVLIRLPRVIISANEIRSAYMSDYYDLKNKPIIVRNIPVQSRPPRPTGKLSSFVHQNGASPSRIVVYQGALMPGRGLDVLVQAARYLRDEVALVFIGANTAYSGQLMASVRENRLTDKVLFMGRVDPGELLDVLAEADLGIVTYQNTCLNNYMCASTKQYEYVAAGLPVILPHFPHLVAFLNEYDAGVAFDPEDPASLSDALHTALDRFPKSPQLTSRLRSIGESEDWNADGIRLLAAYEQFQHGN